MDILSTVLLPRLRDVDHSDLGPLSAAKAVDGKGAREMHRRALEPFEKIRKRVGDRIDIHVELHSLWTLPAAIKIAKAIEPFLPYWFEDPIRPSNLDALLQFRQSTPVWTTASHRASSDVAPYFLSVVISAFVCF